ncbi:MAG: hypothetical protein RL737_1597 [Bacteroidota bacterium]|jgi:hypothetical protein
MSFYVATLYSVVQLSADASGRHHDKLCFVMTKEEFCGGKDRNFSIFCNSIAKKNLKIFVGYIEIVKVILILT